MQGLTSPVPRTLAGKSINASDPLIPISGWPSVSCTCHFEGDGTADPLCRIVFAFSNERYKDRDAIARRNAAADLAVWVKVWMQLCDAATEMYHTLSLQGTKDIPGGLPGTIDIANLLSAFIRPVIDYTSAVANGKMPPSIPAAYDRITFSVPVNTTAKYTYLLPLYAAITIVRPGNNAVKDASLTDFVTTSIPPFLNDDASGALVAFAQQFETAFNNTASPLVFKIAVSAGIIPGSEAQVYVVRFDSTGEQGIGIRYLQADDAQTQAYYFAPVPLSTTLQSFSIAVAPYESGQPFDPSKKTVTREFTSADIDEWAFRFSEAIDKFFTPPYAVPALFLDNGASMQEMIEAKKKIAAAIARSTGYVITPANISGITTHPASPDDAIGKWLQQLEVQLSAAYSIAVQVPVNIHSTWNHLTNDPPFVYAPPRLYGKMSGVAETDAGNLTLSGASLDLASGPAWLTYMYENNDPNALVTNFREMNFLITHMEWDNDALHSSRLSFVFPHTIPGSVTDTGAVQVRAPQRGYPLVSSMNEESAGYPSGNSLPLTDAVAKARSWDYRFTYQAPVSSRDITALQVTFNASEEQAITATGRLSPVPALYAALAQFVSMYPAHSNDLDAYLLQVQSPVSPGVPEAQNAVDALITIMNIVAAAWEEWNKQAFTSANGDIKDPRASQGPLTETLNWTVEEIAAGELQTDPLLIRVIPANTQTGVIPVISIPGYNITATTKHNATCYTYTEAGTGKPLSYADKDKVMVRNVSVGPLDVLDFQNAAGAIGTERNTRLLHVKNTDLQWLDTDPRFIYRTPLQRFASPYQPLFSDAEPIDIALIPASGDTKTGRSLRAYMDALFAAFTRNVTTIASLTIELKCEYQYNIGNTGLPVTVPVMLVSQYELDITDKGAACASMMSAALKEWFDNFSPDTNMAQWKIGTTVFASVEGKRPLLGMEFYLDVSSVAN